MFFLNVISVGYISDVLCLNWEFVAQTNKKICYISFGDQASFSHVKCVWQLVEQDGKSRKNTLSEEHGHLCMPKWIS